MSSFEGLNESLNYMFFFKFGIVWDMIDSFIIIIRNGNLNIF